MTARRFQTGADSMGFDRRATEPVRTIPPNNTQLRNDRIHHQDAVVIEELRAATAAVD